MNEVSISVIQTYINDCLFDPARNWPECEFSRRSYARWAANEVLRRIQESDENPLDIFDDFIAEMDDYADQSEDNSIRFIFDTAKETIEDLALLFV